MEVTTAILVKIVQAKQKLFFFFFFFFFLLDENMVFLIKLIKFMIICDAIKGVLHLWALFLKTWCIFSKNNATLDKVFYGSGQICFKELKITVLLQYRPLL